MCHDAVLILALFVVLSACSSTSKTGRSETGHHSVPPTPALAGVGPSPATKMICESEAKKDIAQSGVGFDTIEPLRPRWDAASRRYSCDYVYAGGAKVTLSVKQASSPAETTAYFDSLAVRLGKTRSLFGPARVRIRLVTATSSSARVTRFCSSMCRSSRRASVDRRTRATMSRRQSR